jgi:hypothetical protein
MVLSLVAVYAIVLFLVVILMISGTQLAGLLQEYAPAVPGVRGEPCRRTRPARGEPGATSGHRRRARSVAAGRSRRVVLHGGLAGVLSSVAFIVLLLFFTVTDAGSFALRLGEISPAGQRLATALQLFAHGSRQYLAVATVFGAG